MSRSLLRGACSLSLLLLAAASPLSHRSLTVPSQDPFYVPPSGWEQQANGAILNSRTVIGALSQTVPLSTINVTTYQVLYKTTGSEDDAQYTVATIFIPSNAKKDKLVHYAFAYDSADVDCSPSYFLQQNTPFSQTITQEEPLLAGLLVSGYTVVSADYEGYIAAYSNGPLMGRQSLDALRATLAFPPAKLSSSSKVAQFGYSGGATATGWAAILQSSYAPELNVVGFLSGGTPADLGGALSYIDGGTFAGFVFAGFSGLLASIPSLKTAWDQVATTAGQDAMANVRTVCSALNDYKGKTFLSTTYSSAGAGLLQVPAIASVFSRLVMTAPPGPPAAPIFYYHCVADQIIPIQTVDTMVDSFCANGAKSIVYERNTGVCEHISELFLGYLKALDQLNAWMDGTAPQAGCSTTNVVIPGTAKLTAPIALASNPDFLKIVAALNAAVVTAINVAG